MVGASRFERPTSRTPSECANLAALRSDTLMIRCHALARNQGWINLRDNRENSREKLEQVFDILLDLTDECSCPGSCFELPA